MAGSTLPMPLPSENDPGLRVTADEAVALDGKRYEVARGLGRGTKLTVAGILMDQRPEAERLSAADKAPVDHLNRRVES